MLFSGTAMAPEVPRIPFGGDPKAYIPQVGFGCYEVEDAVSALTKALQVGYRHFDTAKVYKNEQQVGEAVRQSGIPRGDIFITSKVNARYQSAKQTPKAVRQSLNRLDIGYIDLYLLHDAIAGPVRRLEAWRCLCQYKLEGRIRNIGVSNWNVRHLEQVREAGLEMPAVNQIELHPWCQQVSASPLSHTWLMVFDTQLEIVRYCREHNILIQAYCPLVRGTRMHDAVLADIAASISRTPAQVLLRWSIQHGFVPLPKSITPDRIGTLEKAASEASFMD